MKSLWNDAEAAQFPGPLGARVYTSRLLGRDKSLVLHGGGNTSAKLDGILHIKGTGSDLAAVEESAFTPLKLACVQKVLEREKLDNAQMMRLLEDCFTRRPAPKPSIETLLHAALPFRYVDHTHADAVLAVVNTENGQRIAAEVYGDLAPLVPYHHSGVELARACREIIDARRTPRTIGLVLQFHGVVAFGDSARACYENMVRLVTIAEDYLKERQAWELDVTAAPPTIDRMELARLRASASRVAGFPLVMCTDTDPHCLAFARRPDVGSVSQQGPATPQHAIFTRRLPQVGRDVDAFARSYRDYLERTLAGDAARESFDCAPRIVLDRAFGLCALGVDARYARVAAECYRHDIEIIARASRHDAYRAAPEHAVAQAEFEYGGFERKLRARASHGQPLLGCIALIAPAMQRAQPRLQEQLLAEGAAVAVCAAPQDVNKGEAATFFVPPDSIDSALDRVAAAYGGLDRIYAERADQLWMDAAGPLLALSPVRAQREAQHER